MSGSGFGLGLAARQRRLVVLGERCEAEPAQPQLRHALRQRGAERRQPKRRGGRRGRRGRYGRCGLWGRCGLCGRLRCGLGPVCGAVCGGWIPPLCGRRPAAPLCGLRRGLQLQLQAAQRGTAQGERSELGHLVRGRVRVRARARARARVRARARMRVRLGLG